MKLKYKIEMLSDWHVGSGLDSGADADSLVLKDENNLPYIPGKTIKGLLKDSLYEIIDVSTTVKKSDVESFFGFEIKDENGNVLKTKQGVLFFSNAQLVEQEEIISNKLTDLMYKNIASTAISDKGIAKRSSLRTMEVCIPVVLEGEIEGENIDKELFEKAFKWTRSLGVNRNRGLGRCRFLITDLK